MRVFLTVWPNTRVLYPVQLYCVARGNTKAFVFTTSYDNTLFIITTARDEPLFVRSLCRYAGFTEFSSYPRLPPIAIIAAAAARTEFLLSSSIIGPDRLIIVRYSITPHHRSTGAPPEAYVTRNGVGFLNCRRTYVIRVPFAGT